MVLLAESKLNWNWMRETVNRKRRARALLRHKALAYVNLAQRPSGVPVNEDATEGWWR